MIFKHRLLRRTPLGWGVASVVLATVLLTTVTARAEAPAVMQPRGTPSPPTLTAPILPPNCAIPASVTRLEMSLNRVSRRLASGDPIRIVAIGSSSTAGSGASTQAASYPSRLAVALQQAWPGRSITVLNRGVGGEVAADMIRRFQSDVIAERPDLVLWQVGTNAVLRNRAMRLEASLLHQGIRQLKATGADVVLVDPQFAPKVMVKRDADVMLGLIASAATEEDIALFRRYDLMRHWRDRLGMPFQAFRAPDGLHMNDWSYACVAKALADAIVEAATRQPIPSAATVTAKAKDVRPSHVRPTP